MLEAARIEFGVHGYSGTSVATLVAAAGVNAPTLYHHFEGKSGLFLAAAAEAYDQVLSRFQGAVGAPVDFAGAVDSVLDASIALMGEDRELATLFAVIQFELPRRPELAEGLRPILRSFRAFFDTVAGLAPTALAPTERARRDLGRTLVTIISGLNAQALLLPQSADYSGLVRSTRRLLALGTSAR